MNQYRVPQRQWKQWSKTAKGVFNLVYATTRYQKWFTHLKAEKVPQKHWNITRWNIAWIAANAADGFKTSVVE